MGDHVILLGCVKGKAKKAAPAKELYVSPLWRRRRSYAERSGRRWFILSALHGLVEPDRLLAPDNAALADLTAQGRRDWGERVVADLERTLGTLASTTLEIHAGKPYRVALLAPLHPRGATVEEPLAGLSFGKQLAWYRAAEGVS